MSLTIHFRRAVTDDFAAINDLLTQSQLPLAGVAEHLSHFLLAVADESLLGCAGLEVYGTDALLRSVAVQAAEQSKGVGRALVERLRQQAEADGLRQLFLLTTTAASFFQRLGFQTITREEVPEAVQASVEFQGVCPLSATVMRLALATVESDEMKQSLLPTTQRRAFASLYRAARHNDILDSKTTLLLHLATAFAVGCYP